MLTFHDLLKIELKKNCTNNRPEIMQLVDCYVKTYKRIKLIRHNLNEPACRECYDKGKEWWNIYQQIQEKSKKPFDNTDYIFSFVSNNGKSARYIGCWKVLGECDKSELGEIPEDFANKYKSFFGKEYIFYKLKKIDIFEDYEERLVIDWENAPRAWHQRIKSQTDKEAKTDKEILAIDRQKGFVFENYEKVILSFGKLKEMCSHQGKYEDWIRHLSSVNAVYLIVDTKSGVQYVGSAYGDKGLWGRWSHYVSSENGHLDDNKGIKKYLDEKDENGNLIHSVNDFQFSILHITSANIGENDALNLEKLYKKKLCSRSEHGLNEN